MSANILSFPAKITEPVQQLPRRGRLPRAVTELRHVRTQRMLEERRQQERQKEAVYLFNQAEKYLYALFKLKGMVDDQVV